MQGEKRRKRAQEAYSWLARQGKPFLGWFIAYWSLSPASFPGIDAYIRLRPLTVQYRADGDHSLVDY